MGTSHSTAKEEQVKKLVLDVNATSSSFGKSDSVQFTEEIRDLCDNGKIPPYKQEHLFQIYQWGEVLNFKHRSIVIGCNNKYGYLILEIKVDSKKEIVYPNCSYMKYDEGKDYILSNKWHLKIDNLESTIYKLSNLSKELIEHHGKYSYGYNNCHKFVDSYLRACKNPNDELQWCGISDGWIVTACVTTSSSAIVGGIIGGSIGGLVGASIGLSTGGLISNQIAHQNGNRYPGIKLNANDKIF
jgi:hypothetical protein